MYFEFVCSNWNLPEHVQYVRYNEMTLLCCWYCRPELTMCNLVFVCSTYLTVFCIFFCRTFIFLLLMLLVLLMLLQLLLQGAGIRTRDSVTADRWAPPPPPPSPSEWFATSWHHLCHPRPSLAKFPLFVDMSSLFNIIHIPFICICHSIYFCNDT